MNTYYQADLAYIHDSSHGQLAEGAALDTLELLRSSNVSNGLIVDLGCGSGTFAKIVSEAGYNVLGIDYSDSMIEIAKSKAPKADFVVGSFFDFAIPSCQAIVSIGECLNYLFDERAGNKALEELFLKVYDSLLDRGIFMLDILGPNVLGGADRQQSLVGNDDWNICLDIKVDRSANILTRDMTIFRRVGEYYTKSKETHKQKLYAPEVIVNMLNCAGFKVATKTEYAGNPLREGHTAFIAKKR